MSNNKEDNNDEIQTIKVDSSTLKPEEAENYLRQILEKISTRFTKIYEKPVEITEQEDKFYLISVKFFERRTKLPVPEKVIVLTFKIEQKLAEKDGEKSIKKDSIAFQIENEAVFYPLFHSINLASFETLLDRIARDKYQLSKALNLHTNFEHTRILNLNGETKKLFTIEEDEEIFQNNNSEYYSSESYEGVNLNFKKLNIPDIDKLIKILWKTLVANKSSNEDHSNDEMTFDNFKLLFEYGKLDMNEENMKKLWKYSKENKNSENITYPEFARFAVELIICINAFSRAKYKHENNQCFANKIKNCVGIMNKHFKDYDLDNNQEISFENLKKCLLKENELFTRKEIEIILKQINPDNNFQYWKFDRILSILYNKYFNYQKLYEQDKIFKYLIDIFAKQDEFHVGKLHYKKMKKAFLTENKINLNKMEILLILNQFGINQNPEIDYYAASLILRDIVEYLHSMEVQTQKIDIDTPEYKTFQQFEDQYDKNCKNVKILFISFDEDFDHLLIKKEFDKFVKSIIPYADSNDYDEIFTFMDFDKDGIINYQDFKQGFNELMERVRIKNVIKNINTII